MHFAGGLRRSPGLDCLLMGLRIIGALVAIAAWLAPATACAQFLEAPLPHRPSLEWTVAALADCGVRMPPQKVLDCFGAYMDAFLPEYVSMDAQHADFIASQQLAPHAATNVRQTRRLNEFEEEAMRTESALVDSLFACLAAAAPDQEQGLRDARAALQIDMLCLRCMYAPIDLSRFFRSGTPLGRGARSPGGFDRCSMEDGAYAANAERLRLVRTSHAAERAAAYREFLRCRAAERMEHAKLVEEGGVVGMRLEAAQEHVAPGKAFDISEAFFFDRHPSRPGWIGVVRAQLEAYKAIQDQLTDEQRASLLHGQRYLGLATGPAEMQDAVDFILPGGWGEPRRAPRDIISCVLRLSTLTDEQRQAVRQFGRVWMEKFHQELEARIQRALEAGSFPPESRERNQTGPSPRLAELGKLTGITTGSWGRMSVSAAQCTAPLSEADMREFGNARLSQDEGSQLPTPDRSREDRARSSGRPYPLPEDYAIALGQLLGVDAGQQAVLQSLFDDHRARWTKDVSPMLQSQKPTPGERDAARACDEAFFAAVKAALGTAADPSALRVAALSRRVAEGAGWNMRSHSTSESLCNIPRAVADAPLSQAGRKAAIAAVLKDAEQWTAVAGSMAECRAQSPPSDQVRERQNTLCDQWMTLSAASEDAVASVLPEADQAAWRRTVRRQRWPRCYQDSSVSRMEFARVLHGAAGEQALRQQVNAVFDKADKRLEEIGDAAAACMEQARALPFVQDRDHDEGWGMRRAQTIIALGDVCLQLARTEARVQLPPELARKIYPDVPLDRMAQTAAPAAAPQPPPPVRESP